MSDTTYVAVAGVGMTRFGRFDDRTVIDLGVEAVSAALADAGHPRIDAAFCGSAYSGVAAGHRVLGRLARTGVPIVDVEAGCASGAAALSLATQAIRSGDAGCVLAFGMEKMPKGMIRSSFFEPWQETAGLTPAPAYFALRAQRLLRERELTKDDLAAVVVKNRANGALNPDAMFQKPVRAEDVLASRVVCEPLHLWMLCSPNEGAAAVVLSRAGGGVGASGGGETVQLRAAVVASHTPGNVLDESTPMAGLVDDAHIVPPSAAAARDAYRRAAIDVVDVDVFECQDTDAARELITYEEIGVCAPGEQAAVVRDGTVALGGARPVNPSGGLLSKGEPLGASALGQVVELVQQLRGACGDRQVEGARLAVGHTVGRGANASVVVLSR
jgi:acetyl-CoA acetyltransferase